MKQQEEKQQEVELRLHPKGFYEVWVDNQFLKNIEQKKGEAKEAFALRAEKEVEDYVERLKAMKTRKGNSEPSRAVKKFNI